MACSRAPLPGRYTSFEFSNLTDHPTVSIAQWSLCGWSRPRGHNSWSLSPRGHQFEPPRRLAKNMEGFNTIPFLAAQSKPPEVS